jgi:hypothetical protein
MIATFQQPVIATVTPALLTLAAGWAAKESVSFESDEILREAQLESPVRAAYKTPLDRGLNEVEVVFSVTKQFANDAALLAYKVALPPLLDCSAGDTVKNGTLTFENETDASVYIVHLAVCKQISFKKSGVSVVVTFRFVGGYWATS